MKKFYPFLLIFIIFIMVGPSPLQGQMFSVTDPDRSTERMAIPTNYFNLGITTASLDFSGENVSDNDRLDFDNLLLTLQFNTQGLDLSTSFGGSLTGMDDQSYVNLTARIYNNFPIKQSRKFRLSLPIQLTTDLTQVSRDISTADFRQSSLIIGSGLITAMRPNERISLHLKATPNYGFSFSQGSVFGGSLFRFDGLAKILIHNVFGDRSLAFGYNFDFKSYDIDGDINDYELTAHTFTIGIGF